MDMMFTTFLDHLYICQYRTVAVCTLLQLFHWIPEAMLWIYPYLLPRDCNMHSRSYLISRGSCCYTSHIPLAGLISVNYHSQLKAVTIFFTLNGHCFEMSSWGDCFHTLQITRSLAHIPTCCFFVLVSLPSIIFEQRYPAPRPCGRACNESRWKLLLWFTSAVRRALMIQ